MNIHIEGLQFYTIVGILKSERIYKQKVVIDCHITYCEGFIDYVQVIDLIKTSMHTHQFALLEDGIKQIAQEIKQEFPSIQELTLKIVKPEIVHGCSVGVSKKFNFS